MQSLRLQNVPTTEAPPGGGSEVRPIAPVLVRRPAPEGGELTNAGTTTADAAFLGLSWKSWLFIGVLGYLVLRAGRH